MEKEWKIDSDESDVLLKTKRSLIDYMSGTENNFKGHIAIQNNGVEKATFEITGNINRKDFGLNYNPYFAHGGYAVGSDIKLIANLEFVHQ